MPSSLSTKSCTLTSFGQPSGSIVTARILVVADQLFLLGVNRDHRLTSILEGHDLLVDMLELGIPVGMMAALLGLAIDLAAVVEVFKKLGDAALCNLMPHGAQRRRKLGVALRNPEQWPHWIA